MRKAKMTTLKLYDKKIKEMGSYVNVYEYPHTMSAGYERMHDTFRKGLNTMANEQNLKRARRNVHDIVLTNMTEYTKMLTLTYAQTNLDYEKMNKDFKAFVLSLKRQGYNDLPTLSVVEHQAKRGAKEGNQGSLHLHVIIFTDKFIPYENLKKAWGKRGSVDIGKIKTAKNPGAYVSKYITKEGQVSEKNSYRCSRSIKRPSVLRTARPLGEVLGQYDFGDINRSQYSIKRYGTQEQQDVDSEKVTVYELKDVSKQTK